MQMSPMSQVSPVFPCSIYCNGVARLSSVVFGCYPPFGIACVWDKIYLMGKMNLGGTHTQRIIIKYRV